MDILDILGPIMVGPSSSHTAGAARIGKITRMILQAQPVAADIFFHGSFAETYQGHGSDRAVLGGLLGFDPDDERIRDSFVIAKQEGLSYTFHTIELADAHPNTIVIEAWAADGRKVRVQGVSVGGGNIVIQKINDSKVAFTGEYDTLIVQHDDQPGVIAQVSGVFAAQGINIAGMRVYRDQRGGRAIMVIDTDGDFPPEMKKAIEELQYVHKVILIKAMKG